MLDCECYIDLSSDKGGGLMERKKCEQLWAANKYLVLSKSQKIYLAIRQYLKSESVELIVLEKWIKEAMSLEERPQEVVNAYQHIWSYFRKVAQPNEKNEFLSLLERYQQSKVTKEKVMMYLNDLLEKYPNRYLEDSTIFKLMNDGDE